MRLSQSDVGNRTAARGESYAGTGSWRPFLRCISDVEDVTTALPKLTRVSPHGFAGHRTMGHHGPAQASSAACHTCFPPGPISIRRGSGHGATTAHNSATAPIRDARRRLSRRARGSVSPLRDQEIHQTHPALTREDDYVSTLRIHRRKELHPTLRNGQSCTFLPLGRTRTRRNHRDGHIHPRSPLSVGASASTVTVPPYLR